MGKKGRRNSWLSVKTGLPVKVVSVREVPSEEVYDLEVEGESPTFIANGLLVHNSVSKDLMGTQPRLVGRGIRKFVSALNSVGNETGRRPTVFLTNQIRMKLGVMFGNPETQPGGMAPGFASSIELKMWSGKYQMDESTGKPFSADMNFRVEKNKTAPAKVEGEFRIILSDTETKKKGEVYDEDGILTMAEKIGLLVRDGVKWKILDREFSAKSLVERELLTNLDFKTAVRESLLRVLLV